MRRQRKLEEVILDEYPAMYRLAYIYMKNKEDAMDVVQDSVEKAIINQEDMKDEKKIKSWLMKIVVNTAFDRMRKQKHEVFPGTMPEMPVTDTYSDLDLRKALDELDAREKAVIILKYFQNMRFREIAEILNMNESTVKTVLYRSLGKLKIKCEEAS